MRNALAYVPKTQQSMAAAALRQAFLQPDRAQASQMLRHAADQLRQKWPKLAAFIDDSETDVLSYSISPSRIAANCTAPPARTVKRRAGAVRDGDAALQGQDAADDHEVIVTFRELPRTRTQRRESYLSPPNGLSVVLSLNSAGPSISEARRCPSCCS